MKDHLEYTAHPARRRMLRHAAFVAAIVGAFCLLVSEALAAPPAKPARLSGHDVAFASSGDPSQATTKSVRAECPPGTGVVSGGFSFSNNGVEEYSLLANHPSGAIVVQEPGGDPVLINNGWLVSVLRTDGKAENWTIQAYAVCVDIE